MGGDVRKVLLGIGVVYLMVLVAFIPFTSSNDSSNSIDIDARGGPICQGDECKQANPDPLRAEQLYGSHGGDQTGFPDSRDVSNQYAVLAGISDYPGSGSDLQYCDDDVYDTRDMLIDFGWSASNIHILIDGQATNANIQSEINWMKNQEDANSQVWFHFSGHGSSGNFMTYGSTMTDDTLASYFNGFESSERIIVMDTCHAGSFNALNMGDTIGIMACQSNQYSYDGVFTPTFVDKFTSASVSVEEAFNSARNTVNAQTGGAQTPLMWDNVAGNLLIGNRAPTIGPLPTFTAEEDNPMVLELTQYEGDFEDSGTDLDWMVTSYDVGAIASISGTKSDSDIITLTPIKDFEGSTEIELSLTDSGGQSTKKKTNVVWTPVNDAPTIASLDRTSSSLYRTESLTFKVYGGDIDDTLAEVSAEIEVSLQGSGGWTPLDSSKYYAGHWDVTWTLDKEDEIGTYDTWRAS